MDLVKIFDETVSVQNEKQSCTRMISNEDMQIGVVELSETDRTQFTSIRTLSEGSVVSATLVHAILKISNYYPHPVGLVHGFNEDDYDWTEVCEFCQIAS